MDIYTIEQIYNDKKAEEGERLGAMIQQHRVRSGLTQDQLAEKIGVSRQYISEVERGLKTPLLTKLLQLFHILNIPLNGLYSKELLDSIETVSNKRLKNALLKTLSASPDKQETIAFLIELALASDVVLNDETD